MKEEGSGWMLREVEELLYGDSQKQGRAGVVVDVDVGDFRGCSPCRMVGRQSALEMGRSASLW